MIILSLGSNLGNREANLKQAVQSLAMRGIKFTRLSSIYETEPVGYSEQPQFLNMVAVVTTQLTPLGLLDVCMEVELQLGRTRTIRWGPRIIDIDIIVYGAAIINLPQLTLPHPRFAEREFVLVPLQEVVPELSLKSGKTAAQLLAEIANHSEVRIYQRVNWEELCYR